jgi:DNA helicase IV
LSRSSDEIGREQDYVTMLYGRLDGLRERAADRLGRVLLETGGTPQQRSERDGTATEQAGRLAQLEAAENGLCFGRLDLAGDELLYIGRIGMLDEDADFEPLLVDWRAPAARPFYVATAGAPAGVRRRRHIRTRLRTVVGLDDDALDLDAAGSSPGLVGEAALLSAMTANRTGRMRDVVETIQAEQDRAIRAELGGVLVVQGGPGTGKTAVALHRAAYLLYTHRERLARRGVLIVGPNPTFLQYISHVLPALGETGVVLWTLGELYPGITARRAESAAAAEIKGRAVMADVIAAAVRQRQQVPADAIEIVVDRDAYWLDRTTCLLAREVARRTREPHNLARPAFAAQILDALAAQVIDRLNQDPFAELTRGLEAQIAADLGEPVGAVASGDGSLVGPQEAAAIRAELAAEPSVLAALDRLWPELTPQRLLTDLYASPELLGEAAPQLTGDEREALRREPGGGWSVADVPLLDEAAELLGAIDPADPEAEAELRRRQLAYAQGVLDIVSGSRTIDAEDPNEEITLVTDLVDAEMLLDRQDGGGHLTIAQRAAADRAWTFGHVVVDEAQELSAMAWRLLMRRCPSRSMTVVGDVAQTGDPAGTSSWSDVLEPYVGKRWRLAELSVNYRTPAEIMAVAAKVLARIDARLSPPRSVRESGTEPWDETVPAGRFGPRLGELAAREAGAVGDGRLAVLVPASRADELAAAVRAALPEAGYGEDPDLERRAVVLTVRQAKGLEFDAVIVADPDRIVADAPRGDGDLYVALTRATDRLGVLRPEP